MVAYRKPTARETYKGPRPSTLETYKVQGLTTWRNISPWRAGT